MILPFAKPLDGLQDDPPEALLSKFQVQKLLNQDQAGRRIVLVGNILGHPGLLIAERAAFSSNADILSSFISSLTNVKNLGDNDIYKWYMARQAASDPSSDDNTTSAAPPDLKLNLIWPATPNHFRKYAPQRLRSVLETPAIYAQYVRPFMATQRDSGRLDWVFNIIEGRTEQENVLYRSPSGTEDDKRFLLLPDLNWDRETLGSLHLLALVERRDIWSVRDLKKGHVAWLREMVSMLTQTVEALYGVGGSMLVGREGEGIEGDEVKFYVHYQPTYYHFHIHIVNVALEAGATQAVGKALSLPNIISTLENLASDESGMHDVDLAYTLGEQSELWTRIFGPLKQGEKPVLAG